jgi:hypothetical protein
MRAGLFCAAVVLMCCSILVACADLTEDRTVDATAANATSVSAGGADAVRTAPSMPTYRAGEDAIAALIPTE